MQNPADILYPPEFIKKLKRHIQALYREMLAEEAVVLSRKEQGRLFQRVLTELLAEPPDTEGEGRMV